MLDRIGRRAGACLTLALGCTVVGCGATGLAWVDEPESASGWSVSEQRSIANAGTPRAAAQSAAIPVVTESEPAAESHQRLNHTVTLGQVDAAAPGEQPQGPSSPTVSVTINNYGQTAAPGPGYYYSGYAGFGASRGSNFARGGSVTGGSRSSGSLQPGQSWPAVADHGSSFPYRSAPASPWR